MILIRNGKAIKSVNNFLANEIFEHSFVVDNNEYDCDWYMIKVILHGGELCWTSPIWVKNI